MIPVKMPQEAKTKADFNSLVSPGKRPARKGRAFFVQCRTENYFE
jgi:5-formaminoimidazole-4-carboxamide-1-beta-D-ribofuranosyl 5'-monophosphate synthetase